MRKDRRRDLYQIESYIADPMNVLQFTIVVDDPPPKPKRPARVA